MGRVAALILAACTFGVGGFLLWAGFAVAPTPSFDAGQQPEEKVSYWKGVIVGEGAIDAYAYFSTQVAAMVPSAQHDEAHIFGRALYEQEGVSAFGVCDAQFRYGCFHEFIARAITEHGDRAIVEAEAACEREPDGDILACEHGIGHGILAARGYSAEDLQAALSVCTQLENYDPIGGCLGGVFMEYNQRTMLDAEPRAFTGKPFDICEGRDEVFTPACFFWIPEWWRSTVFARTERTAAFAEMGQWCAELPDLQSRRMCFEGIGNMAPTAAQFDAEEISTLCAAAGAGQQGRFLACMGIAMQYVGETEKKLACTEFSGDQYLYCTGERTPTLHAFFTEV